MFGLYILLNVTPQCRHCIGRFTFVFFWLKCFITHSVEQNLLAARPLFRTGLLHHEHSDIATLLNEPIRTPLMYFDLFLSSAAAIVSGFLFVDPGTDLLHLAQYPLFLSCTNVSMPQHGHDFCTLRVWAHRLEQYLACLPLLTNVFVGPPQLRQPLLPLHTDSPYWGSLICCTARV